MTVYEDAHINETSLSDWKYIAEGGSTIVLSYAGPPNPKFDRTVLRLRKGPLFPVPHDAGGSLDVGKDAEIYYQEPDDPIILFQAQVIERLLPEDSLPQLQTVRVESEWLAELVALVEEARPVARREKDRTDVTRRKAVLATDLVGGDGWAIEIKPKWGFLPASAHLSPETRAVKTQACRFCTHAHYRTQKHGEHPPENYCPLDLYSGDEARVRRAVHGLWDGWIDSKGSANNLRVFVDGHTIHPHEESSIARLSAKILPLAAAPSSAQLRERFTFAIVRVLLSSTVLPTLSRLQRTLDALDVEGLSKLWAKAYSTPLGTDYPEPTLEEWNAFLDTYLSAHNSLDHANPSTSAAQLRYYTLAYLLSMSFKDCSIIVRPPEGGQKARVTVIDLDAKTIKKLAQWERLDKEIAHAYKGVDNKKHCTDAHAHHHQVHTTGSSIQFMLLVTFLALAVARLIPSS